VERQVQRPFDAGWDVFGRRHWPARRSWAWYPRDTDLSARPSEIAAWDDVPDDLKPVLARQMEIYAGFMEHTDHQIGRLLDTLEDLGSSMTR
jgi:arylsulfatase A-like enzyme